MEGPVPTDLTDADGFTASVRPCWPVMRRVAERLAGRSRRDDVLQEALADAWRHRAQFDPDRGSLQAWLTAITANQARKALRSLHRVDEFTDLGVAPDLRDLDLQAAIAGLPDRQQEAIQLFYYAGLPVADVAAAMSCAEGTVKSTLSAARANLHTRLGEDHR